MTEARRDGEWYGECRLFEFLATERRSASDVLGDVISFSQGALRDDLAILAVAPAVVIVDSTWSNEGLRIAW